MFAWRSILVLCAAGSAVAHELTPTQLQLTTPGLPGSIRLQNSSNETNCTTEATVVVTGDAVTVSPTTITYTTPPNSSTDFVVTPVKVGDATITVNWRITSSSANCSGSGSPNTRVSVRGAPPLPAGLTNVPPGGGVSFEQITYQFGNVMPRVSRWGRAVADLTKLRSTTGLPRGFVNIYSPDGLVVPNWPVDTSESFLRMPSTIPPDTFYFQLLNPNTPAQTVTTAPLQVIFSSNPLPTGLFTPNPVLYPVTFHLVNNQGVETVNVVDSGPPPPVTPVVAAAGETFSHILPNQVNVQTAVNQCFPMSVANSLQYLEARYRINVPNDHVPGLKGDNTLVGKMDTLADRPVVDRQNGSGTPHRAMISGKFKYLTDNGLATSLVHNHQGRGFGSQPLANADFTANGITSRDSGAEVTWEWICDQIKAGEDVEITFSYDAGGGHAVRVFGCGKTLGRPWIKYLHDSTQSNDSFGLETPTVYVGDTDSDGRVNLAPSAEIRFAFSESVTDQAKNALTAPPQTTSNSLVNAASFVGSILARGALTTVFGLFAEAVLAPNARAAASENFADAATVYVNGRVAPIFFAGSSQINFQIPEETESGPASVVVVVNNRASELVTMNIGPNAPGIFILDSSIAGPGRGVIQNQDYSLNVPGPPGKPAPPGTAILVYATGLGAMNPPQATGVRAPSVEPLARATATVTATIGGRPATVLFAGAAPDFIGLHQVNLQVPDGLPAGDADVIITVGGVASNTVKVAIGAN